MAPSTILFAGCAALTEVHGDDAVAILDRFKRLACDALDGHAQFVKTVGDAVMVAEPDGRHSSGVGSSPGRA